MRGGCNAQNSKRQRHSADAIMRPLDRFVYQPVRMPGTAMRMAVRVIVRARVLMMIVGPLVRVRPAMGMGVKMTSPVAVQFTEQRSVFRSRAAHASDDTPTSASSQYSALEFEQGATEGPDAKRYRSGYRENPAKFDINTPLGSIRVIGRVRKPQRSRAHRVRRLSANLRLRFS